MAFCCYMYTITSHGYLAMLEGAFPLLYCSCFFTWFGLNNLKLGAIFFLQEDILCYYNDPFVNLDHLTQNRVILHFYCTMVESWYSCYLEITSDSLPSFRSPTIELSCHISWVMCCITWIKCKFEVCFWFVYCFPDYPRIYRIYTSIYRTSFLYIKVLWPMLNQECTHAN